MHYAHRTDSKNKDEWQTLTDHLQGVGAKAAEFASHFGATSWGEVAGLLHDAGKFSLAFQRRLNGTPIAVDHATAGAQYITEAWKGERIRFSRILAYVIAGHHAGLTDFGTVAADERSLARRLLKDIEPYKIDLERYMPNAAGQPLLPPLKAGMEPGMQFSLFVRMLFSCLVDADSLDTERFAEPVTAELRGQPSSFAELFARYRQHMDSNFANPGTPINQARAELLVECMSRADGEQGMYALTLPTGSGKTLASLGFALRHAVRHNLRRIVYVIPYTSIIEQNAKVFRDAVGAENVLEHHSNVQHDADEDLESGDETRKLQKKLGLAAENWDYPIVVTTNVQFFESLFSNKRSRCRKLHNLADSVIVLDEAQMMNGEFFKPCMHALEELTRNYGATVVLSTATQPDVRPLFAKPLQIQEMIADVPLRFEQFRRVRLATLGMTDYDHLAERMAHDRQTLVSSTRAKQPENCSKKRSPCWMRQPSSISVRACVRSTDCTSLKK